MSIFYKEDMLSKGFKVNTDDEVYVYSKIGEKLYASLLNCVFNEALASADYKDIQKGNQRQIIFELCLAQRIKSLKQSAQRGTDISEKVEAMIPHFTFQKCKERLVNYGITQKINDGGGTFESR
jgi:hypothetical protein